jgi:hypothetical protein
MGAYDYSRGAFVVAERNAHAWTEVYFPGYGWIEFEPTPTERLFVFADVTEGEYQAPSPSEAGTAPETERTGSLWLWAIALGMVVLFVVVWPPRWFRPREVEPRVAVHRTYHRLLRRARWVGISPDGGQTPSEYLRYLATELDQRAGLNGHVTEDIYFIAGVYQRARYSDMPITAEDRDRVEGAWRRLKGKLLRAVFARSPERQAAPRQA